MQGSDKHSTIKGILLTLKAWSRAALHGRPYRLPHTMHGRPDQYKDHPRATIRRPE